MLIVPLAPIPSQVLSVQLAGQDCRIALYRKTTGMFLDLWMSDALIIGGVLCLDRNRIVRDAYLGFAGDLAIADTQGTDDPEVAGLGSRWVLAYLEPDDID